MVGRGLTIESLPPRARHPSIHPQRSSIRPTPNPGRDGAQNSVGSAPCRRRCSRSSCTCQMTHSASSEALEQIFIVASVWGGFFHPGPLAARFAAAERLLLLRCLRGWFGEWQVRPGHGLTMWDFFAHFVAQLSCYVQRRILFLSSRLLKKYAV